MASYYELTRKQWHALRELQEDHRLNPQSDSNFLHPRTAEALERKRLVRRFGKQRVQGELRVRCVLTGKGRAFGKD
jgi:hypothetical protein